MNESNRPLPKEWTNCYLPDRSPAGSDSMDDLIETLAASLIARLDDLECHQIMDRLMEIPDVELRQEARLLQEEIQQLKNRLYQL